MMLKYALAATCIATVFADDSRDVQDVYTSLFGSDVDATDTGTVYDSISGAFTLFMMDGGYPIQGSLVEAVPRVQLPPDVVEQTGLQSFDKFLTAGFVSIPQTGVSSVPVVVEIVESVRIGGNDTLTFIVFVATADTIEDAVHTMNDLVAIAQMEYDMLLANERRGAESNKLMQNGCDQSALNNCFSACQAARQAAQIICNELSGFAFLICTSSAQIAEQICLTTCASVHSECFP